MAATAWAVYHNTKLLLGKKVIDLSADTFKCALFTATAGAHSVIDSTQSDANARYGLLTTEVGTAYGYAAAGVTIGVVTWANAGGTITFDGPTDPAWTASGGSIVCRNALIYDDTVANKYGVCWSALDAADVTVTDGNTLTITLNAAGVFTLA